MTLMIPLILFWAMEPTLITQWGSATPVSATSVEIGEQGVQIRREGDESPEVIPWYRIRSIEPRPPSVSGYQKISQDAWRAHTRLQRGDYSGARPIYERLGTQFMWKRGPQSAEISAGLVQCLLDQHERSKAVTAMLAWFVATEQTPFEGLEHDSNSLTHRIAEQGMEFDPIYRLPFDLPPVFLPVDRLGVLDSTPDGVNTSARIRLITLYYQIAHTQTLDEQRLADVEQTRREIRGRDQGLDLLSDMVMASYHPDATKRAAARDALDRRTRVEPGGWREVWSRIGLGSAMLQDDDPLVREQGAIELLHVTVRLADVRPVLTQIAAELLQDYFKETGRSQWGAQIMNDALQSRPTGGRSHLAEEQQTDG